MSETYEALIQRSFTRKAPAAVAIEAASVRAAKAAVISALDALYPKEGYGRLSVIEDGEVIARHEIWRGMIVRRDSRGELASVLEGKWRELPIPAATVASRGYRVVGKYSSDRGSYNYRRTDVCDRCGSGIQRVVVIEDRHGTDHHVGTDCAKRMGLPVVWGKK